MRNHLYVTGPIPCRKADCKISLRHPEICCVVCHGIVKSLESQGDTAIEGNRERVMERTDERKREIGKLKHSTQTHPATKKK